MKWEMVFIVLLGGLLLTMRWKDDRRRIQRWLRCFKEQLPRRWHPKTPEACPHCRAGTSVTVQKIQRTVIPYSQVKSQRLIQTYAIERVNLTLRQGIALLGRSANFCTHPCPL